MNKRKSNYLISIFVCCFFLSEELCSQEKRANELFESYNYESAIPLYKELTESGTPNQKVINNIARCYLYVKDYENAEKYFSKAVLIDGNDPMNHFLYGTVLKNNLKLDEAKNQFIIYSRKVPSDKIGEIEVLSIEEIKNKVNNKKDYAVTNLQEINTKNDEYSPSYYQNGIVFISEGKTNLVSLEEEKWIKTSNDIVFFSMRKGQDGESKDFDSFSEILNSIYHDGPVCFNNDQTEVYYSRIETNGKIERSSTNHGKIYSSKMGEKGWTRTKPFNLNNNNYSVSHPSLSDDGNSIYFVSDMPGGYGGEDIYVSRLEGTKWGKPQNLGPEVNSTGNELFPYIRKDGVLFFSSDGHKGIGGLDIFSSELVLGNWTNVTNAGHDLNSAADDFGIIFENNIKKGLFSSNRDGGAGKDDIYSFNFVGEITKISGKVLLSKNTNDIARNTLLTLLKGDGSHVKVTATDSTGSFVFENIAPNQKYMIKINERDSIFSEKKHVYLTNENGLIVRVAFVNEKGQKFLFKELPSDLNTLPQFDEENTSLTISGSLLAGEGPSTPVTRAKINLVDTEGKLIQTVTSNAFGAFVLNAVPMEENFSIQINESDPTLLGKTKVIIANKNGKEIKSTKSEENGNFKFQFLSSDHDKLKLMQIEHTELRIDLKGSLLSSDDKAIANSRVNLTNRNGEIVQTTTTDTYGKFIFKNLPGDQIFFLAASENDPALANIDKIKLLDEKGNLIKEASRLNAFKFEILSSEKNMLGQTYVDDPWLNVLNLKSKDTNSSSEDSITIMENIYYDLGKFVVLEEGKKILDKVVQIMKSDPKLIIELRSHTDSRASDEYNMVLSEKRAKAGVEYMISLGISPQRISGKGFGETKLVNKCANNVECTEAEHAKNRRTEFVITRK